MPAWQLGMCNTRAGISTYISVNTLLSSEVFRTVCNWSTNLVHTTHIHLCLQVCVVVKFAAFLGKLHDRAWCLPKTGRFVCKILGAGHCVSLGVTTIFSDHVWILELLKHGEDKKVSREKHGNDSFKIDVGKFHSFGQWNSIDSKFFF